MSYITARPESIEIRSNWLRILIWLLVCIGASYLIWLVIIGKIGDLTSDDWRYWLMWVGVAFLFLCAVSLLWSLLHAGEVIIRLSSEGVWIKGGRDGTTIPWKLVDNVVRSKDKNRQYTVLEMSDENYRSLNRGLVHLVLYHLNKLLGVKGIWLNVSVSTVSKDQLESLVAGYWNDWKVRQGNSATERLVEPGLKGKR